MTERIEKMHGPTHASSRDNAFTSSEVPRVLHVIGAMDRGGAETFIMNLYRTIDRKVIQFDFLVNEQRECDYDEEIRSLGGNIYIQFPDLPDPILFPFTLRANRSSCCITNT